MIILPVVGRELIAASRNKQIYRSRFLAALAAVAAMIWILLVGTSGSGVTGMGRTLFEFTAYCAFCFCLFAGLMTSDLISVEKREGTLGLLFLTSLRGHDVILGKLAAAGLGSFYSVLGLLPVLSVAMLLGGIQYVDIARVGLVWINTLFVSLTLGITISTLSQKFAPRHFCHTGADAGHDAGTLPVGIWPQGSFRRDQPKRR